MERISQRMHERGEIAFVQLGVSFVLVCGKGQILFVCVFVSEGRSGKAAIDGSELHHLNTRAAR